MPTSPKLFALTKTSSNVQIITRIFASKYLNKYAAGKEEHGTAQLKAGTAGNSFRIQQKELQNLKITGAQIQNNKSLQQKRQTSAISASSVSQTEYLWWLLKLPVVITNIEFIHVPSISLANRGGKFYRKPRSYVLPSGSDGTALSERQFLLFPQHNCFTNRQKTQIQDASQSNFSNDKVTLFSIRPPELLFVHKLKDYFAFFVRDKKRIRSNKVIPTLSHVPRPWIDGSNSEIKLRSSALHELQIWFTQFTGFNDPRVAEFEKVLRNLNRTIFRELYVADSTMLSTGPAEVVFSKVYTKNNFKFLLHLLYTMGSFETELDLFSSSSLRSCFVTAGFIAQKAHYDITDSHHLLKRYTLEQLIYIPGGNVSFSSRLVFAAEAIQDLVLNDSVASNCFPPVLVSHLTEQTETTLMVFLQEMQERLFQRLQPQNVTNVPNTRTQNPTARWLPAIIKPSHQSLASHRHQQVVLTRLFAAVDQVLQSHASIRNQLVLGRPGSGKSHPTSICLLYAMMNGLQCYVTSLAARRASHFNCLHIHHLFCIGVNKKLDPNEAMERAMTKLHYHPEQKALLISLDVLVIEEIGLINGELLSTINLILQNVRENTCMFVGVMVVGNEDTNQLPAIGGSDVFLSPTILFCFQTHFLTSLVRMLDPV